MTSDPLQLERHTAFATRLARGLVADEHAADDLVQETWLAVLRRPPRDVGAVRGYIATTLRRFAGRAKRSESRRAERERDTARGEALPSSSELAAAMEHHRRVVEALLELNEPTRASILLRYLEGLPPRDIAARSGEPVETVRTRIKRGLAALRERLDEREGGRGAWAVALAPLSGAVPGATPLAPLAPGTAAANHTTGVLVMTIQTKVAVGALLALTAGLAWRASDPDAPDPGALVSPPLAVTRTTELEGAGPVKDPVGEHRTAVVATETPAGSPAEPVAPSMTGSIRVLDADGVAHAAEDGSFTIAAGDMRTDVAVEAGRFALARPDGDAVRVGSLELGGRPAFLSTEELALPARAAFPAEGGTLDLVATWSPPSVLRVVDARTGAELSGLTVLRGMMRTRDAVHPGWTGDIGDVGAVFARDASSPLELTAFGETESWWVHAPGYTWGWVRFDHRTGGEREVALEPGGADLAVRLAGFDPGLNLWLHVFPAGWDRSVGSLSFVRHPQRSTVVFEGLPPGPVQVRAELGIWHDGPRELAREELELSSGVRTEMVLDLERDGALPAAVPLAGRVVLPVSHPDLEFSFELMPLEGAALRKTDRVYHGAVDLERVGGQPLMRRFDAGRVTPGRYLFVSSSLQCWERFDVGPGGAPDVEIALPELRDVSIRVVDEGTGERLALDRIAWSAVDTPRELSSWTLASVDPERETGEYVFTAPLRNIWLSVRWDEYAEAAPAMDVSAGAEVHEVLVRRLPGAWMRLADGEATVPFEWAWNVKITPAGGSTEVKARITRIEGGRAWVAATEAGMYVVDVPPLAGFRPVPPQTLELGPDGGDEVVIELVRG